MIISQAYSAFISLCSGEPQEHEGYTAHLGKYNPEKVDFQMQDCYEEIITKDPKPGIADTTWIDTEEMVMVIKGDLDWKIEVRKYTDRNVFNKHVAKIKEIEEVPA